LDALLNRHRGTDDRVVLVSHGGFFSYLMRAVLGVSTEGDSPWFSLNNASVSRLDFRDDGRIDIQYINGRSFLPAELVT